MRPTPSLPLPCLCLVTDRSLCNGDQLVERVAAAVSGGVDLVQLREKDLPGGELMELARKLRTVTAGKALLVINDRLDVALAAGADGLHLPEGSISVRDARRVAPAHLLVGRSVHSPDEALLASREEAHYLVLGTIFPTTSKPGTETGGLARIRATASLVETPVLAIGGVDSRNVASVVEAGAQGAAVISAILAAPDPEQATRYLKRALLTAWEVHRAAPIG